MPPTETSVCKYYLQNHCTRGTACTFSHQQDCAIDSSTISSKVVCVHHQNGFCRFGSRCRQLHNAEHDNALARGSAAKPGNTFDLHTVPNSYPLCAAGANREFNHTQGQTPYPQISFRPCKFFEQGNCAKGAACPFPHIPLDTKAHTNPFDVPFKRPQPLSRLAFTPRAGDAHLHFQPVAPRIPCKFFGRGECVKGAGCQFLHISAWPLLSLPQSGRHSDLQGAHNVSPFHIKCIICIMHLAHIFTDIIIYISDKYICCTARRGSGVRSTLQTCNRCLHCPILIIYSFISRTNPFQKRL